MSTVLVSFLKAGGRVDEGEQPHLDKQPQAALMVTDDKFEPFVLFPS